MSIVKDAIKKILSLFDLEIHRKKATVRCSLKGALENLKRNGISPSTVLDVGAAFGSWSLACADVFPNAQYLLLEPLYEYEPALKKSTAKIKKANYRLYGVTSENGDKTIHVHRDLVGSSMKEEYEPHNQNAAQQRLVSCKTLDDICASEHLSPTFLIKLDIQGAELEALSGAIRTLTQTEALLMEVSLIACIKDAPLFKDVINKIQEMGFVTYDIFGHNYRPHDQALAQVDILFVPESSPLRKSRWYANKAQRQKMNKKFLEQLAKEGVWIH